MGGSVVTDDLWRSVTPQVIGALVRRYRDFDRAEEAAQEALLAAPPSGPRRACPTIPRRGSSASAHGASSTGCAATRPGAAGAR